MYYKIDGFFFFFSFLYKELILSVVAEFLVGFVHVSFFLVLLKNSKIIQNGLLLNQYEIGKHQQLKITKLSPGTSSTFTPVKSIDL